MKKIYTLEERITLKGLERKFNKELGYNLKPCAFSYILDSFYDYGKEYKLLENLSIDDIDIYRKVYPCRDCFTVSYYGLYYLCTLYEGLHY